MSDIRQPAFAQRNHSWHRLQERTGDIKDQKRVARVLQQKLDKEDNHGILGDPI